MVDTVGELPSGCSGNAVEGAAILIDTSSTLIHSNRSLVATIGVDELIVVDTPTPSSSPTRHARKTLPLW